MANGSLRPTVRIAGHAIHPIVIPVPIVCFVAVLLTDILYWGTARMMWADFSAWFVTIGLIFGVIAAIIGLIDFFGDRDIRDLPQARFHMTANVVVLILALLNTLVHSRDAWTSVVPGGLILSTLVVVILAFSGWMGWSMVRNQGIVTDTRARERERATMTGARP